MEAKSIPPQQQNRRKWSYVFFGGGCILLAVAYLVGTTDNPPGILSMLIGLFALVLAIVFRVRVKGSGKPAEVLLYWAPRALCIVFALFCTLFALDVFQEGKSGGEMLLALLMHLIPTFLILLVLALAWRWEWVGGFFFAALAVVYAVWAWGKPFGPTAIPLISGILLVIGALFLLNWRYKGKLSGGAV